MHFPFTLDEHIFEIKHFEILLQYTTLNDIIAFPYRAYTKQFKDTSVKWPLKFKAHQVWDLSKKCPLAVTITMAATEACAPQHMHLFAFHFLSRVVFQSSDEHR